MSVQTRDPVLRRKVTSPMPPSEPVDPGHDGPAPDLVRSFSRSVNHSAQMMAEGGTISRNVVTLPELLDSIDPEAFVVTLSSKGVATALAVLDQSGFAAVIESMTIGRLGPRAPTSRRPTATDASLLADLLNRTLADSGDEGTSAFRFERPVPDHRLLTVLLDEAEYVCATLNVTLVSGAETRPASLMIALPQLPEEPGTTAEEDASPAAAAASVWASDLEASVLRAPASLRAELGRITLPLAEVLKLGVGGALTLPLSNLEEVQLVALDGTAQALGRLGQSRGMRAVRLTTWPNGHAPEPTMTDIQAATAQHLGVAVAVEKQEEI